MGRRKRKKRVQAKFYRINQYIQAPELRLIDAEGKQIGVMKREEALVKAREESLDLVEVAPGAKPPVVRLISFKKFKYLEAKKRQQEKKSVKGGEVKQVRLTPFIAKADFEFRIKRTREFLEGGNKVKLTVRFVGRQITRKEFGKKLLDRFLEETKSFTKADHEPRWAGRDLFVTLSLATGGKK